MALSEELADTIEQAVHKEGEQRVLEVIKRLLDGHIANRDELTIVGNEGMHNVPQAFLHGEQYVASRGNLDLSSCEALERTYKDVLTLLAKKLREKTWRKIYLIPTGPTTLVLQIKLLVYHITRFSTVDLFYSKANYCEVDLDYRSYLVGGDK